VIATKFTTPYRSYELGKGKTVNFSGNHKRSIHMSVRDSLKKLQTDFIDILYLHWWDWTTSIEEIMDSLVRLVLPVSRCFGTDVHSSIFWLNKARCSISESATVQRGW
jgi:aryl-alcohol dehydrogenase-like predicted oxidoreductase